MTRILRRSHKNNDLRQSGEMEPAEPADGAPASASSAAPVLGAGRTVSDAPTRARRGGDPPRAVTRAARGKRVAVRSARSSGSDRAERTAVRHPPRHSSARLGSGFVLGMGGATAVTGGTNGSGQERAAADGAARELRTTGRVGGSRQGAAPRVERDTGAARAGRTPDMTRPRVARPVSARATRGSSELSCRGAPVARRVASVRRTSALWAGRPACGPHGSMGTWRPRRRGTGRSPRRACPAW